MRLKLLLMFGLLHFAMYGQLANNAITLTDPLDIDITFDPTAFVHYYQLQDSKTTMLRLSDSFALYAHPDCQSLKTGIFIPSNTIVFGYKYFPDNQCWAISYLDYMGFVPNSMVSPIHKHGKYNHTPQLHSKIAPEHTQKAKEQEVAATVMVQVYIDNSGIVNDKKMKKEDPMINTAVINADKKVKLQSGKNNNIGTWVPMSLEFE